MIYCDSLDVGSAREALKWSRELGTREIVVLAPRERRISERMLRTLFARAGYRVSDATFFAGHLKHNSGESVYLAARRLSTSLSFAASEGTIVSSPVLSSLNADFGRNTLLLFQAKSIVFAIEYALMRLLVVEQLAAEGRKKGRLILQRPMTFDPGILHNVTSVEARFYGRSGVAARLGMITGHWAREIGRAVLARLKSPPLLKPNRTLRSVLTMQEDDLGLDHSCRLQPHWLSETDHARFSTYIVLRNEKTRIAHDKNALSSRGVTVLPRSILSLRGNENHPIYDKLRRAQKVAFREAVGTRLPHSVFAALQLWTLVRRAKELANVCEILRVGVYLTGEPYLVEADAIQLVASSLDVKTIAYQYSNLAFTHPVMMTTSDQMLVFSKHFESLWTNQYCAPGAFVVNGYVFDASFAKVRNRAQELRRAMNEAGARFVLCYFDESVQKDRYGNISDSDHRDELLRLLRLVLDDPTTGLIVKSQFEKNSPSRILTESPEMIAASKTGRYRELVIGKHRNIVFPAEAALAADIAIGHSVGATAALEAALAGTRCVLLNPYGLKGVEFYGKERVVFDDLSTALKAIAGHRAGDPAYENVGDWSPVVSQFDPFRDGGSARRLYAIIETALGFVA